MYVCIPVCVHGRLARIFSNAENPGMPQLCAAPPGLWPEGNRTSIPATSGIGSTSARSMQRHPARQCNRNARFR